MGRPKIECRIDGDYSWLTLLKEHDDDTATLTGETPAGPSSVSLPIANGPNDPRNPIAFIPGRPQKLLPMTVRNELLRQHVATMKFVNTTTWAESPPPGTLPEVDGPEDD